jgi:hypothetical protein
MREGLHEGDCLEVMRKMADASFRRANPQAEGP